MSKPPPKKAPISSKADKFPESSGLFPPFEAYLSHVPEGASASTGPYRSASAATSASGLHLIAPGAFKGKPASSAPSSTRPPSRATSNVSMGSTPGASNAPTPKPASVPLPGAGSADPSPSSPPADADVSMEPVKPESLEYSEPYSAEFVGNAESMAEDFATARTSIARINDLLTWTVSQGRASAICFFLFFFFSNVYSGVHKRQSARHRLKYIYLHYVR